MERAVAKRFAISQPLQTIRKKPRTKDDDEDDEEEEEDSGKGRPPRSVCKMREPPEPEAPPAHSDGKRIMD
jgi:hypothetical protein